MALNPIKQKGDHIGRPFVVYFVVIKLVFIPVASQEVDSIMPDVMKLRDSRSKTTCCAAY